VTTLGLGWVASGGLATTGRVVRKRIDVSWEYGGGAVWNGDLLWALAGPDDEIDLAYDPSYVGAAVDGPRDLAVGESLHEELRNQFRSVEYRLGVCGTAEGDECAYSLKRTRREGFNRARLADRATVTDLDDRLLVHNVEPVDWSGTTDTGTFDFDRRHDEYGR